MHLDSPTPEISRIRAAHTLSEKAHWLVLEHQPDRQASGTLCRGRLTDAMFVFSVLLQWVGTVSYSSRPFFFFFQQELLHTSGGPAFAAAAQKMPLDHLDLQALLRWLFNLLNKKLTQRAKQNEEREEYVPSKRTRKKDFSKTDNLPPKDFKVMIIKMLTRKNSLAV